MSQATRAQKIRLGLFLGVALTIAVGTLVAMLGLAALEQRDQYRVRFQGSVSGLSPGSPVKYNGIEVGRVGDIEIDPDKPSGVIVLISLKPGTPIRTDTVAVLNMQGITGLKFIELMGGSEKAARAEPGSEIESSRSAVDELTSRAMSITQKLEDVLDNIEQATGGKNADNIGAILSEVRNVSEGISKLLSEGRERAGQLLDNVDGAVSDARAFIDDSRALVADARSAVSTAQESLKAAAGWVDRREISSVLRRLETSLGRLDTVGRSVERTFDVARVRLGADELGAAMGAFTSLATRAEGFVQRADVTLVQAREDLIRALTAVVDGAESFAELAQLLRDDPAALIRGHGGSERELP